MLIELIFFYLLTADGSYTLREVWLKVCRAPLGNERAHEREEGINRVHQVNHPNCFGKNNPIISSYIRGARG
jgi:hypothetical protein